MHRRISLRTVRTTSSLEPRLPLGLDRLFKIAPFGWVDPILCFEFPEPHSAFYLERGSQHHLLSCIAKPLGRAVAAGPTACVAWGGQLKLPRPLALRSRIQNEPLVLRRIRVCEWEGGRSWNFDGAAIEVHKALPDAEKIKQNSTQREDEMSIKPKTSVAL